MLRLLVPLAALAVAATPLAARIVDPAEVDQAGEAFRAIHTQDDAATLIRQLDGLRKRGGSPDVNARIAIMRGAALSIARRFPEADAAFAEAEQLFPDPSQALRTQLSLSFSMGNIGGARHALDRLIDAFPDIARTLTDNQVYPLIRSVRKGAPDAADTLYVRLAGIGWGEDRVSSRDDMVLSALKVELKRGNRESASSLARRIVDISTLEELLTKRVYEPVWAEVEARVGDRMEQPARDAIAGAERWLAEAPQSNEARRELMLAYRNAERLADADRVGAAYVVPDDVSSMTEDDGWLVNDHAEILLRLGRKADSDARFAALRRVRIEQAPWLINMIINRAVNLTRTKRYAEAWPLITEAETLSQTYGSPYARQLVRRMQACVAYRTKRPEADTAIQSLLDNIKDSEGATIGGLMCIERTDEAARRVLVLMENADERDRLVDSMMPDDDPHADPSPFDTSKLLERADVRASFDKVARLLPARFAIPHEGLTP